MEQQSPYYLVTKDAIVALMKKIQLSGDVFNENTGKFDDPVKAFQTALEIKETHFDRLEGSELSIYRLAPSGDLEEDPVLVTGTPHKMRSMWKHNVGGAFPEHLLDQRQFEEV